MALYKCNYYYYYPGPSVCIQHKPLGEDHHEPPCGARQADDKDGGPCTVSTHRITQGYRIHVLPSLDAHSIDHQ